MATVPAVKGIAPQHTDIEETEVLVLKFGLHGVASHLFGEIIGRGADKAHAGVGFHLEGVGTEALVAHFTEDLQYISVVGERASGNRLTEQRACAWHHGPAACKRGRRSHRRH